VTTEPLCALALVVLLIGCREPGSASTSPLRSGIEGAPLDITKACELASVRCSRCHPIERLSRARVDSPKHWQYYVNRMRLQPASGISIEEAHRIVRCLVYRSFGREGLQEIDHGRLGQ
jgi:hypothetical protein